MYIFFLNATCCVVLTGSSGSPEKGFFNTGAANGGSLLQVQQQQYPQLEGWASGGDARALMMKLLTTAITFVQILFVVAGLLINTVTPFVRTPTRLTVTALAIAFLACYYYKQEDFLALVNKLKARTNFGKNS